MKTDLTGMTRSQCPAACSPDKCIITETASCGHPAMTGVQHALKSRPGVLDRYGEACKVIGVKNMHEVLPL